LRLDGRATLTIKYTDYKIQAQHFASGPSTVVPGH